MTGANNAVSNLFLCLVGAPSTELLIEEVTRIIEYLEQTPNAPLRDIVYTAAQRAQGMPEILALAVDSSADLLNLLRSAEKKLQKGAARIKDKVGVYYFRHRLAAEGKTAFIYPGVASYHPDMLREVLLRFPAARKVFDELNESFSGQFLEGSAMDVLYPVGSRSGTENKVNWALQSAMAIGGTHAGNELFTRFLTVIGVQPQGVMGVGVGAFSAAITAGCLSELPRQKRIQLIRNASKIMVRLANRPDIPRAAVLSIDKLPLEQVEGLIAKYPGRAVISSHMTETYTVVCAAHELKEELEQAAQALGAVTISQYIVCPFNTPWCAKAIPVLTQFFRHWLRHPPAVPIYSSTSAQVIDPIVRPLEGALSDQLLETVRLAETVNRMYEDGYRIFIETGARGTLSMLIHQILGDRPHLVVAMNRFHRPDLRQMCHSVAQLAAHGLPVDLTKMDEFKQARLLDFDEQPESRAESNPIRLDNALPRILFSDIKPLETAAPAAPANSASSSTASFRPGETEFGMPRPLLNGATVLQEEPGMLVELNKMLHLGEYPFLCDFSLGSSHLSYANPQLRGMTIFSVPASLELMGEAAERLMPGLHVANISSVRAQRWLGFEHDAVNVTVRAERIAWEHPGESAVKVQLRDDSPNSAFTWPIVEATYILTDATPSPQLSQPIPLTYPRAVNWNERSIYPDRLFHGPLLRAVRHVDLWSEDGIDFEIEVPALTHVIRYTTAPLFTCMPLLLDAVTSGFALWRSHERFEGAISLPFRAHSIRFFTHSLQEGQRLKVYLRLMNVTPKSLVVDISASDGHGNLVLQIKGWEELSTHVARKLYDFIVRPGEHFLTDPLPTEFLPAGISTILSGSVMPDYSTSFFTANQELWLKTLAFAVLSPSERDEWQEMRGAAGRRLEWLLGRTAAKEAVRRHLLNQKKSQWASADITIWPDDSGKPHPLGPWRGEQMTNFDLTIAHTSSLVVAAVAENAHIGIDIERVGRDLSEEFTKGVFTMEEQSLAAETNDPPVAMLCFWCAKEALSKALGTGIRYTPTDLRVRNANMSAGTVTMELLGQWLQPFPMFKGQLISIRVGVYANHAIATCVLPNLSDTSSPEPA